MRKKSIERVIAEAARDIKRKLVDRNAGKLPRTVREWQRLVRDCYVQHWPDFDCPPSFRGALDRYPDLGYWVISYNPYLPDRDICKSICHELFELFAHFDHGSLFDEDYNYAGHYDGNEDTFDIRHRIALYGESLCFRNRKQAVESHDTTTNTSS